MQPIKARLEEFEWKYDIKDYWIEVKEDGYRSLIVKKGETVKIFFRSTKEMSSKFPKIVEEIRKLKRDVVLDGEIINKNFETLTSNVKKRSNDTTSLFLAFDIIGLDTSDLRAQSYEQRRELLSSLSIPMTTAIKFNDYDQFKDEYVKIIKKAEGFVLKRVSSQYDSGPNYNWLKIKKLHTIDLRILKKDKRKVKWSYQCEGQGEKCRVASDTEYNVGDMLEVIYQTKIGDSLRFPRILRVRVDK